MKTTPVLKMLELKHCMIMHSGCQVIWRSGMWSLQMLAMRQHIFYSKMQNKSMAPKKVLLNDVNNLMEHRST